MIDQIKAIKSLLPTAQVASADGVITWVVEPEVKLTEDEIEAEVARLTALEPARIATENRRFAYTAESDPLFFKWQAGETTQVEWQAKRNEIKARYPK